MNKFIRLSDLAVVTEKDIDPLCTVPSLFFQPNSEDYAVIISSDKLACDSLLEYNEEIYPTLVDGVYNQQWEIRQCSPEQYATNLSILKEDITNKVQERLDNFAKEKGYGDSITSPIVSACSYAASTHPKYGVEGRYCLLKREETWDKLYEILADVEANTRTVPRSFNEIVLELPILNWEDCGD